MHSNEVIEAWHSILFLALYARCYYALVTDEFTGDIQREPYGVCFFADEVVILKDVGVGRE